MEGLRVRETRRERAKLSGESSVLSVTEYRQKILPMTEAAAARAAELARLEAEYASTNDFETLLRINEIRKGV